MGQDTDKFSAKDIHILEGGLGWIKDAQDAFANKLFHRLLRDHPEVRVPLQLIGLQSFSRHMVQTLDTIIGELRSCGRIQSPLREQWADLSNTTMRPLEPGHGIRMAETYLDVFSELAEDAWSPAMESAWRNAIHEVSVSVGGQQSESLSRSSMVSPFQLTTRRKNCMSHSFFLFVGTLAILAVSLASVGLWSRARLAEVRLQGKPTPKKIWCSCLESVVILSPRSHVGQELVSSKRAFWKVIGILRHC